jgi:hypothetical protein
LQDENGDSVQIELKGYHIPNAEVCLFSPQVLLKTISGHALQIVNKINIALENGINLCAQFCPQSNLPMIPLGLENNSSLVSGMKLLVSQSNFFMKSMPLSLYCIKLTQICLRPKKNSFCGTNVYPTPQSNGFKS